MAAQHNQRIMKNSPLATSMRFDCRWVELVGASHLDLLCRAVEADAEFALALGLAALCYSTLTVHQWSEPGGAARGVTLAGRAIAYLGRDDEAGLASTGRAMAITPRRPLTAPAGRATTPLIRPVRSRFSSLPDWAVLRSFISSCDGMA